MPRRYIGDAVGGRQSPAFVLVNDALYLIGGFSYSGPRSYRDVCRLRLRGGKWEWETLPCAFPWPVCEALATANCQLSTVNCLHFISCQEQPGLDHGVRVERDAVDTLVDQPAGELRVIRRALPADPDVLALLAACADRHRE